MDDTTLEKLLQAQRDETRFDATDGSLTDEVMSQLPAPGDAITPASPSSLVGIFALMLAIAVAIGMWVAPDHQHDHRHPVSASTPPAMSSFDSSTLLVAQ